VTAIIAPVTEGPPTDLGAPMAVGGATKGVAERHEAPLERPATWTAIARHRLTDASITEIVAPALICLAVLTALWSRLVVLDQGLWGDEAGAVVRYISHGPSAIWSAARWIPNNHVLFDFLTWVTTGVIGVHTEATYRLWGVIPTFAGGALIGWWLWHRFDRWVAAIFAVLATAAPLYFDLGTQARGYGLGFLASAVMLVAADRLVQTQSRKALVLFSVAGFIGMATLQNFVGAYVAAAAVLVVSVATWRREIVISVVAVGAATLAWYAPLLSTILGYKNNYGVSMPWDGFIIDAPRDLFGNGIHALDSSISITTGAVVAAIVLLGGAALLIARRERALVALVIIPTLATYLLIEIITGYLPRFASFAFLPLIALAAIALGLGARLLARVPRLPGVLVVLLVAGSLVVLDGFARYAANFARVPFESANTAAEIVNGIPGNNLAIPAVTNYAAAAFAYYVKPRHLRSETGPELEQMFCSYPGRFLYIEQKMFPPHPSVACLIARGSFRVALPERRSRVWVWIVPRLAGPSAG
jgi:hypothetical protein